MELFIFSQTKKYKLFNVLVIELTEPLQITGIPAQRRNRKVSDHCLYHRTLNQLICMAILQLQIKTIKL
jgi:hypothetical protein